MLALLQGGHAAAFSLDDVTARAKGLADKPYAAPANNLPPAFQQMQFADYIKIQPRVDNLEWKDLGTPFKLGFYHQGMQFSSPVRINEIVGKTVQEIRYDTSRFDFGDLKLDRSATAKLGYAGFRVMYPVNRPDKLDEVLSVLGASYFRVIGKGQVYGLSSRGLAIDTGLPIAEEFPAFREFWIERPNPQDKKLVFYALLDSQRATGAYRFELAPGDDATLKVQARVFMRDKVTKLGVAPLTSMFLFGPNQQRDPNNFRPALHDSNGLSIHTGDGEWLWRPLNNPRHLAISQFTVNNPRGFGLLQRGREFSAYEDLKDRYDLRPSAWIVPEGDWGKGKVELVEIPTPDETNDNIVAYWTPDVLPPKGTPLVANYTMHWTMDERALVPKEVAWVKQTLRSAGEIMQANLIRHLDGSIGLLIDFEGASLANLAPSAQINPQVSLSDNAELIERVLQVNPATKGQRLTLRFKVKDPKKVVELRAALVSADNRPLTETWSYQLPPDTAPKAQ
ncbi:glucan biosynthesis protein G [Cupriavidus pampae]|uniref:Glucans biosynthesis protein G n=1 Tax=Cupriavidus pampae TaxID=659251 RepID=A0ABN7YDZ8_9BURK|nr:glucan biosynthesis protein G [Cupriavidus pampae]CAG9170097.1 Glucans biosynthesis protein G [Cupriavidus pampae]